MLDILILMAGRGTRFKDSHPDIPKPLVPLHGEPLIRWVVENLRFEETQRFIFVALKDHVERFDLKKIFSHWNINFEIVEVTEVTEGAACSALMAANLYRNNELIIANSDQIVVFDHRSFLTQARKNAGLIMTMKAEGTKWSYVREEGGQIVEVAEKKPISNQATVGIYYFNRGENYINAATEMIACNDRVNNEFYLAPTYNYLIRCKQSVQAYPVGNLGEQMFGVGTSADFMAFESSSNSLLLKDSLFRKLKYKAVLFDLDGVLTDTRELHFTALADALNELGIHLSMEEHRKNYDGLPTYKKIELIAKKHSLDPNSIKLLNEEKQKRTLELLRDYDLRNPEHIKIFQFLAFHNIPVGICSNTKRETLDYILQQLDIKKYLAFSLSNADVSEPKPSPEIYLKAIQLLGFDVKDIVVFEDSQPGITSARAAKLRVIPVENAQQITLEWVKNNIS